jgi:hypothetical protein
LTRAEAVAAGRRLLDRGVIRHVLDEHGFEDARLFYRFSADEIEVEREPRDSASATS